MELRNKVAIITGSSRGIGKGIALAYAAEGANVVVTARTESPDQSRMPGTIHKTVEEINALHKGKAIAVRCDVTQEEQVDSLMKRTLEEFGRIDIIFNNAGGSFAPTTFLEIPMRRWDRVLELNLRAVVLCCKAVAPIMIQQKGGHIIQMSSGAAVSTSPNMVAYNTSKAALERLTLCLAEELKPHNIAVNAYRPGGIWTEGMALLVPQGIGQMDPPSSVGPSTVWLAKQTASTFTGQIVSRGDFGKTWGRKA